MPTGMEADPPEFRRQMRIPPGGTGSAAQQHDWGASELGPVDMWAPELRIAAAMILGSNIPMLVAWGPDLLVVHNDSYGEMVLGDRRPALGRPLREAWADSWDIVGAHAARVLQGETVYLESSPRLLRRGGRSETAFLTFCYNPLRDVHGAITGIFGVVTAVGDDSQAERRLRETEERFRLIADSAPVPIWVTQLDRKRSFVNRAYVDFLGIGYEEAIELDWRNIIHPDDYDRIIAESIAGEARLQQFILVGRYRGGDAGANDGGDTGWRWLRSISQPRWGPGGEHVGFIGVAHDITDAMAAEATLRELNETLERRVADRTGDLQAALERLRAEVAERERAEEALQQAQKMEAVGRLTGGIAHDFNNLLTPVIGGLEVIAATVTDPRLKRLAAGALESARRGAKLTTQLLTFSRIQRISIAPVAVNQVIENLREILQHTIGRDVAIQTHLHGDLLHASCDENQLENAILNLVINARDAMPDGGVVTITTAAVREPASTELGEGDYVSITVADNGIGMPPEVAARATEPFFSTKAFGKGTGLGLAQVHGIATQSGGTVRIVSREGEGTRISILLPQEHPGSAPVPGPAQASARTEAEAAVIAEKEAAAPASSRIFVVDDDADVRLFIAELLGELGHAAEAFEFPEAAIEAAAQAVPDLVLIDFAMPSMNGAELARVLREHHPSLPMAFVTGYAESEQLESALGENVPVLRKPFSIDQLSAVVGALLRHE